MLSEDILLYTVSGIKDLITNTEERIKILATKSAYYKKRLKRLELILYKKILRNEE